MKGKWETRREIVLKKQTGKQRWRGGKRLTEDERNRKEPERGKGGKDWKGEERKGGRRREEKRKEIRKN